MKAGRVGKKKTTDKEQVPEVNSKDQSTTKKSRDKSTEATKQSEAKGSTTTRISKQEKESLSKSNTALFVSLSKSLIKRRRQALEELLKSVIDCLDSDKVRPQCVIRSSNSYLAVVFDTTKVREKAFRKLEKLDFAFEGKSVKTLIYNFGVYRRARD